MIFAMALAALASCSENEQSELNFSDIQGTATIKGQVTYNNGFRTDNGAIVSSDVPAANIPVIAKVDYDNFSSKAEGTKIIEVTTDAEGKYSITIPCGQKPVAVKVQPRVFTAPYFMLITDANGQPKTIEVKAIYEPAEQSKSVVMGDNQTANFLNQAHKNKENVTSRTIQVKFEGKVEHEYPSDRKTDAGEVVKLEKSTTVKVRVYCDEKDGEGNLKDTREVVGNGTVSSGNYNLQLSMFDDWDISKLKADITIGGFTYSYTKVVGGNEEDVSGYYEELKKDGVGLSGTTLLVGCKNDFMFDAFKGL